MKNDSQIISNIENYIANNFRKVQEYFPMLGHLLMDLTSDKIPSAFCQKTNYMNAKLFLYVLCFLSEQSLTYTKAHSEFKKLLTNEILPDSYFKFNDGYIYSKSYNPTLLNLQIEDTALDFKMITEELIKAANVDILDINIFRNFSLNILTESYKKYLNNNDDMFSNEYLEMLFIKILANYIKLDIELNTQPNPSNNLSK